jgi:DNA-binding IscR family transcriptional regulator
MLDYDTLFAISMVQTLGRCTRPMYIADLTASHNGQVILQKLRNAGLVKIYIESSCCELQVWLPKITLLDVVRAVHGHLDYALDESQSSFHVYGEAGIQLEKIKKLSENILASVPIYDVWLVSGQSHPTHPSQKAQKAQKPPKQEPEESLHKMIS